MSKRKPRAAHPAETAAPPAAIVSPRSTKRRWGALAAVAITLLVIGWLTFDWRFGLAADAKPQFVGGQTCASCHQSEHAQWQGSHHDLAMDLANEKTVLGDFSGATLEHHGVTSTMFRRDGKYLVNTEGADGKLADFEVKYVFGVDPLQQYMVEFDRPADLPPEQIARVQVLRISWDTHKKKWFHLDAPDVSGRLDPSDDLHWTGVAQRWNTMCADCHSTNLQKNFDPHTTAYKTTFSEIDVSCEACHGPGSLHVQLAGAISPFWDRERGYALAPLKQSSVAQVEACAPCHSRRRQIHGDYVAGCNYYDNFANDLLTTNVYHADGQIQDEDYEYGSFIQSKMFHKEIRCSDCHNPHSGKLKQTGNQVCTSCHQHPAGKYDTPAHHRHNDGSSGAQCVNCHMPETTYMAVDPRRDHSLRVPRPDLSVELGTPNSCTGCHLTEARPSVAAPELRGNSYQQLLAKSAGGDLQIRGQLRAIDRWAADAIQGWYGKKDRPTHFGQALAAARSERDNAEQQLISLLSNREAPAIARSTAAFELARFTAPEGAATTAIGKALHDRDPQVRAIAVGGMLGMDEGALLTSLTPLLSDPSRLVRNEAIRVLSRTPAERFGARSQSDRRAAINEFVTGMQVNSDRAIGHLLLGGFFENLGDVAKATAEYELAIQVEPTSTGARWNLAALLEQEQERLLMRGQQSGEVTSMERAQAQAARLANQVDQLRRAELALLERDSQLVPTDSAILNRLGLAQHLLGWRKEAETSLLQAASLSPSEPQLAFHLAVLYHQLGRDTEALNYAKRAAAMNPASTDYANFVAELSAHGLQQPRR